MIVAIDDRPILIAIAGPNGAGKSTFFHSHLAQTGLRVVNPDDIAREMQISAYEAAELAQSFRDYLVGKRTSFIFETVLSDPVGDKIAFLANAVEKGYNVILCFIGLPGPKASDDRVALRVSQGGHDVTTEKLYARYPRTLTNLKRAISQLPAILVFDNGNLANPFRKVAEFQNGTPVFLADAVPEWLEAAME